MKFSVNSTVFLNSIFPVIETSQKGDKKFLGFNKINLNVTKSSIFSSSYNGALAVEAEITELNTSELLFTFEKEGKITIPSDALNEALMSFPEGEEVLFELVDTESSKVLYIREKLDTEQYQTIPCCDSSVEIPEKSKKITNEITINKDIFEKAMKSISFAFGSAKGGKQQFLYWVLRANKDSLRFISGTGALFAVLDVFGKEAYTIDSKVKNFNTLFLNEHIPSLLKIISEQKGGTVKIQESDKKDLFQIIINSGLYSIILSGMNPDIEWIDENVILNAEYEYKIVSKISDWDLACKGSKATFTDQIKKEKRPHKSLIEFDFSKNIINVKADEALKSSRKVQILDKFIPKDISEHKCSTYTDYISQIPSCWDSEGTVQLHFRSGKQKSPIVAYFNASDKVLDQTLLKRTNTTTGVDEKFAIIFVQLAV